MSRRYTTRGLMIVFGTLLSLIGMAWGRTWHVPSEAPTIQAGIDSATAGDVVAVACGEYTEPSIQMKSGVTLRSESGDPACVTLRKYGAGGGAPIYCQSVENAALEGISIVETISSPSGGAVFAYSSSLDISNCVFQNNYASGGGGIEIRANSSIVISGCLFIGNTVPGEGGAVAVRSSSATVTDCTFSGNSASYGGGVFCDESFVIVRQCTMTGNSATDEGAALDMWRLPAPVIERSIVAFNTGSSAVYCRDAMNVPALQCCNIYGNPGGDWDGCIASQQDLNGNISKNPEFCSSTPDIDRLWTLQSDSPCIGQPFGCARIGAWPVGCQSTAADRRTWGGVKALYQ